MSKNQKEMAGLSEILAQEEKVIFNPEQAESDVNCFSTLFNEYKEQDLDERFKAMEEKADHQLKEATSSLVKMEAGQVLDLAFYHPDQNETLEGEDGKAYECAVTRDREGNKLLFADVVVLSNQQKIFSKPEYKHQKFIMARFKCEGMKGDKTRQYRNIKILTF
jgi:hypothetical protein